MAHTSARWSLAFCASLLAALAAWLTIAAISPGYVADIESRKARAKWVTEQGIEDAYRMRIDYPPGNLYLFSLVGHYYRTTIDPSFDHRRASASQTLTWLVKLPPTLFHMATGAAVFLVGRRLVGPRRAWIAATVLLFDPAAMFDVAHQGQYDPVHTLFSFLAVAALSSGKPLAAGAAIGLAALTKPQAWILLPLIAVGSLRLQGGAGLVRCALGGAAAVLIGLLPFILNNRIGHLTRLWEYMNTNSTANHVISANAHNLWWLPTLAAGRWVDDWEALAGPISYRLAGVGLVLLVLALCLTCLWRQGRQADLYLVAATLAAGWFFFTPRAHEYHAFFVLPFLAIYWPRGPRRFWLYALASAGLLLNLALHDPLIVGALAGPPEVGSPLPGWFVAATLANVALFVVLFGVLVVRLARAAVSNRSAMEA